jgi:hypothetical protein
MAGEIREDAMKLQRREFLHLAARAACLPTLRRAARAGLPGAVDSAHRRIAGRWLGRHDGAEWCLDISGHGRLTRSGA